MKSLLLWTLTTFLLVTSPALATKRPFAMFEKWEAAICFSAYRDGQSPKTRVYPSEAEILDDLRRIQPYARWLRMYDCTPHGERTLRMIREHKLPFKVMLGGWIDAEFANPANTWQDWSEVDFEANIKENDAEMVRLIRLANEYADIVGAVAVGNEALVDWTDHPVSPERVLQMVEKVRAAVPQPVTVCDNWVPWVDGLQELGAAVDFISLHTYPLWEGKTLEQSMAFTKMNYYAVKAAHPDTPIVITEAGWCTKTNSDLMITEIANEENQAIYLRDLLKWCHAEGIPVFPFEAFDENWKGSDNPLEPEKHWGIFYADRSHKPAALVWLDTLYQLGAKPE